MKNYNYSVLDMNSSKAAFQPISFQLVGVGFHFVIQVWEERYSNWLSLFFFFLINAGSKIKK